jgi:hypothetical protein
LKRRASWSFLLVLVAAGVIWVLPFRQPDCNTASHFALVQSLAAGSRTIDRVHGESCDISWWHGNYYANKAPGLAIATVPWYLAVKALNLLRPDPASAAAYPRAMRAMPRRNIWLMALWGSVLPALGLLLLVRRFAERISAGSGTPAAAILAFATLLSPFGGLYFSHALSAFLVFASFAAVAGPTTVRRAAAAGLLAGAAVVVEYPNGIIALVVAAYILAYPGERQRRIAAYLVAFAAGVSPLIAYGWWTFGTPLHLSYVGAVLIPGITGHDVLGANSTGFFGVEVPSVGRGLAILAANKGLLAVSPVLALAPSGIVLLWRESRRREAAAITAVVVLYVLYNAGYYSPLGGATPGPRFLVAILPFLAVAVAATTQRHRLTLALLATASTLVLLAADLTQPLISFPYSTHDWWYWIRHGDFTTTVFGPGRHGWFGASLIALAVAAGALGAALSAAGKHTHEHRSQPQRISSGLIALSAWSCLLLGFEEFSHSTVGRFAIAACLATLLAAARLGVIGIAPAAGVALTVALTTQPTLAFAIATSLAGATLAVLLVARGRARSAVPT